MNVIAVVIMVHAQEPSAREIDAQSEPRDRHRLLEMDDHWVEQPQDRFVTHPERDETQDDGAGERRQFAELPGAEREARVAGMPAGEQIGEAGDRQRDHMGRHVPAVGDKRDRAEKPTADDFDEHHRRGQCHDPPGAPLVLVMAHAEEGVTVRPRGDGVRMHCSTSSR